MLAAVQSLRLVGVLPVQGVRLGWVAGWVGVEKAAMLAAVQSLRLVGYYQSGPSAGLWLMGGRTILG